MAQEPSEVRESIEETRAEMSETVDAIQERLSPAHIKEEVKQAVTESARETRDRVQEAVTHTTQAAGQGVYDRIRANPVPVAMVGIGLGWLAMSTGGKDRSKTRQWDDSQNGSGVLGSASERLSAAGGQATHQLRDTTAAVQEQASELGHEAQAQVQRARGFLERALEENPLALGAAAVAAGAAVGMLVPESRRENELLGDARAAVQGQIAERAEQFTEKAEQVMQAVQETAKDDELAR